MIWSRFRNLKVALSSVLSIAGAEREHASTRGVLFNCLSVRNFRISMHRRGPIFCCELSIFWAGNSLTIGTPLTLRLLSKFRASAELPPSAATEAAQSSPANRVYSVAGVPQTFPPLRHFLKFENFCAWAGTPPAQQVREHTNRLYCSRPKSGSCPEAGFPKTILFMI
ncbi:hypothetical protein BDQ17DRAFT_241997 [Cyathus striatus]|nr:hypothetical protein BDQ17DRAFT_241997 [Cyathus striatus]